jgi:hypothetical protein
MQRVRSVTQRVKLEIWRDARFRAQNGIFLGALLPRPRYAWGEGGGEGRHLELLVKAKAFEATPLTLTLSP